MIVARRYARALYEEAERVSKTDAVDKDVAFIRRSLDGSRELADFFQSPIVSREKKESAIRALFADHIDELTLKFLTLLVEKQREDLSSDIVDAYRQMRDGHLNIVEAHVRAADDLDETEQEKLAEALGQMTGKQIRLRLSDDKELIGGLVIRIGDTVYDGSVQHQLEQLRDKMEIGSYLSN